jgi:hypothetical protein
MGEKQWLDLSKSVALQGSEEGSLPGTIVLKISIFFNKSLRVFYMCVCLQRGSSISSLVDVVLATYRLLHQGESTLWR